MDPLIDSRSRFLQRHVFSAIKHIERTDWRGKIFVPKYESAHGLDHTRNVELLGQMPSPGDKRNERIALALHDDEIERITIVRPSRVLRAARIAREQLSQHVEVEILDFLVRVHALRTNAGADKRGPWDRQCEIEGFEAFMPDNQYVCVFDASVEYAVHKAGRARVGRQDAGHLTLEKEHVARAICSGRKSAMESI